MALTAAPFVIPWAYPGSYGLNKALSYYNNEMYGPAMIGAGAEAESAAADEAAGGYYGAPSAPTDTGGRGQEGAQARFAALLQGLAKARSAGNAARSNSLISGAQGTEKVASAAGNDISNTLSSDIAYSRAKGSGSLGELGLAMGAINDIFNPGSAPSNIYNTFSGNKTSMGSQLLGSFKQLPGLSSAQSSLTSMIPGMGGGGGAPSIPGMGGGGGTASGGGISSIMSGLGGSSTLEGFTGAGAGVGAGADAAGVGAAGAGAAGAAAPAAGAAAPAAAGAVDAGGTAAAGGFSSLMAALPGLFAFL